MSESIANLKDYYPFPAIRGNRISRFNERRLGRFELDADTAMQLGVDNLGVFVGGIRDWSCVRTGVMNLSRTPYPGRWLVVCAADFAFRHLTADLTNRTVDEVVRSGLKYSNHGCVTCTTPEGLQRYVDSEGGRIVAAGVLLLDPDGIVYKARGQLGSGYIRNDRPQHIARFRSSLASEGWHPPFFLFTKRPAKSQNTGRMLNPFSISGWQFVDGASARFGKPPASSRFATTSELIH